MLLKKKYLLKGDIREIIGRGNLKNLFAPVDLSSLAAFRILFGTAMFIEVFRFFQLGWVKRYWITPKYHFTYWPFDFISPLPGDAMYILLLFMEIFALCIALGLFYRAACSLFFLCWTYTFLIEAAHYLNHYYLICLVSFVMIFIPAHRSLSLDSKFFKKIHSETVSSWSLWLARFMVGIPYFFGGIAKINSDWLRGQPMQIWIQNDMDFPVIGKFFDEPWLYISFAYAGLLIDLLIVPMLMFKQTRNRAFLFLFAFNLMNSQFFNIGIFPWFMLCSATLFLDPSWFRKLLNRLRGKDFWPLVYSKERADTPKKLSERQKLALAFLGTWVFIHMMVPLRHFILPGHVHWSEEGYKFAWHMMVRSKYGYGNYTVRDKLTGKKEIIDIGKYYPKWQRFKAEHTPDFIWQVCRTIKNDYANKGMDVEVFANIYMSLNGRKHQQFTDPFVDIASMPRPVFPPSWIVPLETPLNERLLPDKQVEIEE